MNVHHIGYLVVDINAAILKFEKLGFVRENNEPLLDSERDIYIFFLNNGGYRVELVQPVSEQSPLIGLSRKYRNSPYHICYEADDIYKAIDDLCEEGYVVAQKPQRAACIKGSPYVSFLMSSKVGMIELVENLKSCQDE